MSGVSGESSGKIFSHLAARPTSLAARSHDGHVVVVPPINDFTGWELAAWRCQLGQPAG